ncbi:MAG: thioredoxin fold domain-containing protein [Sulfuriflexus sp.]|nr:thioredoxin fold domain-containing protein [Sulfuriflexus sp.]
MRYLLLLSCLISLFGVSPSFAAAPATQKGDFKGVKLVEIPSWFKPSFLDIQEDINEATESGKRVMVYFHQNGCPYCAKLVKDNFSDKRTIDYMAKHFDAVDINMWGDREVIALNGKTFNEKSYSASRKVWFTPTILFFDEKGKVALRINGYYPKEKFLVALRYVAERKNTQLSFPEYYKKFSIVKKQSQLASESFFTKPSYDLQKLKQQEKPLAILFEEGDCKACDNLHKITLKDKDTIDILKQFNIVQLDRWADTPVIDLNGKATTAKKLADTLGVTFAPYAVLYDKGVEVIRIEGFLKSFHVQSVFDYVLTGDYKKETSFQRYIEHRAMAIRNTGKTVDIWK